MPSEIEKLVERLLAATAEQESREIAEVLDYAHNHGWLSLGEWNRARATLYHGGAIDAVRSLINEECWCWGVGFSTAGYSAHMEEPCLGFEIVAGKPGIATPAIALTIAALEARKMLQANVRPLRARGASHG